MWRVHHKTPHPRCRNHPPPPDKCQKQVALLIIHIIKEFLFLLIQHVYRIRAALRIRGFPRIGQRPVLCKRVACILIFYKICAPGTVFHKVVPLSRDLIPSWYRPECLRSCRICGNCCHSCDHAEDRCHSSYFSSSDHMIASAFFFLFTCNIIYVYAKILKNQFLKSVPNETNYHFCPIWNG